MHTITSPTGASVTKALTEEELQELQASNYFSVTEHTFDDIELPTDDTSQPTKPRIHIADNGCESCSA